MPLLISLSNLVTASVRKIPELTGSGAGLILIFEKSMGDDAEEAGAEANRPVSAFLHRMTPGLASKYTDDAGGLSIGTVLGGTTLMERGEVTTGSGTGGLIGCTGLG